MGMITKWKVFNFKSIREETELVLGPLTILLAQTAVARVHLFNPFCWLRKPSLIRLEPDQ